MSENWNLGYDLDVNGDQTHEAQHIEESLKFGSSNDDGNLVILSEIERTTAVGDGGGSIEEEKNGFVDVGSTTAESVVGGEFMEVHVPIATDQEVNSVMVETDGTDDENQFQDAAMFVDAPEELILSDGRNVDVGESMTSVQNQDEWGGKLDNQDFQIQMVEGKEQVYRLTDELASLQIKVHKAIGEKETMARVHKDEREMFMSELADLYHQLELMNNQHSFGLENNYGLAYPLTMAETEDWKDKTEVSPTTLQLMIRDCSKFAMLLNKNLGEKLQSEGTIRELHAILFTKDQDVEELGAKVSELSITHDVVISYLGSLQSLWSQEILEHKRKEFDLMNTLNQIEDSNKSLMVQLEKEKESVLMVDAEVRKTKMELDQEKAKSANAKEKLGMAVTKGKALVQQRDSLKRALAEKTNELEKCLIDLKEKSNSLEAAEVNKGELVKTQSFITTLQESLSQKEIILKEIEETLLQADAPDGFHPVDLVEKVQWFKDKKDALKQALTERTNELEKCLVELQEKSEEAQVAKDEFVNTQSLITSLQESLSQKEIILKEIEETLSQVDTPEGLDLIEKFGLFKDQRNALKEALAEKTNELEKCSVDLQEKSNALDETEFNKEELAKSQSLTSSLQESLTQKEILLKEIEEALSHVDTTDGFQPTDLVEKFEWFKDQRNSLKQALTEKTNELEKCLVDLQEKSNALEETEVNKEELVKNQSFTSSLQESLSQKEIFLRQIEEILSQIDSPDGFGTVDVVEKVRLFMDQRKILENVASEYGKLKDILSFMGLPETIISFDLESKVNWLWESLRDANDKITELQGVLGSAQVSVTSHESVLSESRNEIGRLTTSLLSEKRENGALRASLEDISCKYEAVVENEFRVSSEKGQMMRRILEASGMDDGELYEPFSNMDALVEKCILNIKEQTSASLATSHVGTEQFERIQTSLYVQNQELTLCNELLEEATIERAKVLDLSNELKRVSLEVITLTDERDSMRKDLERSDERYALLREKLSMAVKKGKGLVQEREGLRNSLNEKNTEIEKLKLELQQHESMLTECRDQISRLSSDSQCIQKLKVDLAAMKDQRDQLEHFLLESNGMLQKVIESIEDVVLPVDAVFNEPVEKVKWIAKQFHEYHVGRTSAEQELEEVKREATSLAGKFEENCATITSLEIALSNAERKINLFAEEAEDGQSRRSFIEQELEKAKEETCSLGSKFQEACANIKSLEETLFDTEKNLSVLVDGKNNVEVHKTALEKELEKLKSELGFQANKLAETNAAVESHKNVLLHAQNNISLLVSEKENADKEILTLNAKLIASKEELAGTHGSLENQFAELFGLVKHFNILLKDDSLLSSMMQGFKKNFESLRNMSLLLESIRSQFIKKGSSEDLQEDADSENGTDLQNLLSEDVDGYPYGTMHTIEKNAPSLSDISSYFIKIVEGFETKNKFLEDKFENCSSSLDELIVVLLRPLLTTRDEVFAVLGKMESLKLEVKHLEAYKHAQESTISTLQHDINILLLACSDAAKELQVEVDYSLDASFDPGTESLTHKLEKLKNVSLITIENLQNKLKQNQVTSQNAIKERDLNCKRVSELESDLEALQSICSEMKLKVQDYQDKEYILKEKNADLPSMKTEVADCHLLADSAVKTLFEKINGITIPLKKSDVENQEFYGSTPAKKLFDIIDNFIEMQRQMELLSHDKKELQSSLDGYVIQTESLESEAENAKNDLAEMTVKLEKIVQELGGNNVLEDQKFTGVKGFLPLLESLVMTLSLDTETSKSIAQESVFKLEENQKVIHELSTKVKMLEDTVQSRPALSALVQERSILESSLVTGSEISEIENVVPLGRKSTSPVPYAAHVRTMRKGSSDHLALNIDSESDLLINHRETDDDKGHVFKSLNTSGLVPVQGKLMADRVDGLW
ncbi:hypothetical protein GIB67_018849 [Kingdonia uniflora]|uniref:Uncharacterized protein n=1 Tax=Kingdonia uniflora TaxID=39325 RepID=A0A7J7NDZ7_9MAGN|nr:hypothetical protein GIB67_018849 [Kingdonia uniflora]